MELLDIPGIHPAPDRHRDPGGTGSGSAAAYLALANYQLLELEVTSIVAAGQPSPIIACTADQHIF